MARALRLTEPRSASGLWWPKARFTGKRSSWRFRISDYMGFVFSGIYAYAVGESVVAAGRLIRGLQVLQPPASAPAPWEVVAARHRPDGVAGLSELWSVVERPCRTVSSAAWDCGELRIRNSASKHLRTEARRWVISMDRPSNLSSWEFSRHPIRPRTLGVSP